MTTKYDADPEHPWAKQWRIPRITCVYPDRQYEVALCVPHPGKAQHPLWDSVEPTENEARIIGSYIDFRRSCYREGWAAKMLEQPFDEDDSTNTVILVKTNRGWKYRRASYYGGALLYPHYGDPEESNYPPNIIGLAALLEFINKYGNWNKWVEGHAELFTEMDKP